MTILNKSGGLENILIKSNFKFNTINEFVFKKIFEKIMNPKNSRIMSNPIISQGLAFREVMTNKNHQEKLWIFNFTQSKVME